MSEKNYRIEIGYDWDLRKEPENDYYLLEDYCTDMQPGPGQLPTCVPYRHFVKNDKISFHIYNVGANADAVPQSLELRFLSAVVRPYVNTAPVTTAASSPTSDLPGGLWQTIAIEPESPCVSWVFGQAAQACWRPAGANLYTLDIPGGFLFSAKLVVQLANTTTTKTFYFDPEMVVGEGTGGN